MGRPVHEQNIAAFKVSLPLLKPIHLWTFFSFSFLTSLSFVVFFCSATKSCLFGRTLDTISAMGLSMRSLTVHTKLAKDSLDTGNVLYYSSTRWQSYIFSFSPTLNSNFFEDFVRREIFPLKYIESVSPFTPWPAFSVRVSHRWAYWPSSILACKSPIN